jgi:hypothetical protein
MKSAWKDTIVDWAAVNSGNTEEVDLNEYADLLQADADATNWDKEDEQFFFEPESDDESDSISYV